MNDRYLYRAKRTDNGEWITGIGISDRNHGVTLVWKSDDGCLYETYVDHSTICQCTGLKDKNGKMIWENDVVSVNDTLYVCRFDEDNFEWEFQNCKETIGICCFHSSDIEITGNAIDNQELLEVGE